MKNHRSSRSESRFLKALKLNRRTASKEVGSNKVTQTERERERKHFDEAALISRKNFLSQHEVRVRREVERLLLLFINLQLSLSVDALAASPSVMKVLAQQ